LRSWVRPAESMTVADGDDNGEACAGQVARARESVSVVIRNFPTIDTHAAHCDT